MSGKAVARANAISHGLTSRTVIPRVLRPERIEDLRAQLDAEFEPATPSENVLLDELARHAAWLELAEQVESAAFSTVGPALARLMCSGVGRSDGRRDTRRRRRQRGGRADLAHLVDHLRRKFSADEETP